MRPDPAQDLTAECRERAAQLDAVAPLLADLARRARALAERCDAPDARPPIDPDTAVLPTPTATRSLAS